MTAIGAARLQGLVGDLSGVRPPLYGELATWLRLLVGDGPAARRRPAAGRARAAAESRGLLLAAGPRFGTGHAFDDRLRLPYTQPVDVIERGVELIADAAREVPSTRPVDQAMAQQIVV